jgi:ribosome-binding protein aMBF1 (putative translation factor)
MSAHTKGHLTGAPCYIEITVATRGIRKLYKIPNTDDAKKKLDIFLHKWSAPEKTISWNEATPWEELAADRIAHYTEAGLALRGARYREGLSQKKLAELCDISQDNLSRIERGKRVIGEKTAKKLAKALHVDYRLFLRRSSNK